MKGLVSLVPERFLTAEYEAQDIKTSVLCSAVHLVTLRYNQALQEFRLKFYAEALNNKDGTPVVSLRIQVPAAAPVAAAPVVEVHAVKAPPAKKGAAKKVAAKPVEAKPVAKKAAVPTKAAAKPTKPAKPAKV